MNEHRIEFADSENPWTPTAAIAEINQLTGSELELVGLDEQTGGTAGAAYVRWPDGRECALTRSVIPFEWMRRTADLVTALRKDGFAVPRHDLVIELSDGRLAVVQERLRGRPATRVDSRTIDAMVLANEQFDGILAGRPDARDLPFFLHLDADDHVRIQTLDGYSDRSQRLSTRIQEVVRTDPPSLVDDGLVHPDFGLGNILFDEECTVSGVVDWNGGATRGDHRIALLALNFNAANEGDFYGIQPGAVDHLTQILHTSVDSQVLRLYWAVWLLRKISDGIRKGFSPERIERAIALGETRLA